MSDNCQIRNPLTHSGVSQRERLLEALKPEYAKIDERTPQDLIVFASNYAKELIYYNTSNLEEGDWQEFIDSDISTILAKIAVENTDKIREDFNSAINIINSAPEDLENLQNAFKVIAESAQLLNTWLVGTKADKELNDRIKGEIVNNLKGRLNSAIAYDKGAEDNFSDSPGYLFDASFYSGLDSFWEIDVNAIPADTSIYVGNTREAQVLGSIESLTLIFNAFYKSILLIVDDAPERLESTLNEFPDHEPHMGLFLTFIHLFKYAQDHINTLTERHLEYYYREVLNFAEKEEVPDEVHLIFEAAKNITSHLVEAGTLLEAGEDDQGNKIEFETTEDIVVNKASVGEIKTVFTQKNDAGEIEEIFAAPKANFVGGQGEEPLPTSQFWAGFGESQTQLSTDERTMPDSNIGFAIASPILLMKEGIRTIDFRIKVKSSELNLSDAIS